MWKGVKDAQCTAIFGPEERAVPTPVAVKARRVPLDHFPLLLRPLLPVREVTGQVGLRLKIKLFYFYYLQAAIAVLPNVVGYTS